MLKLLKATPRAENYADAFIARYERLLVWSLQLTDRDHQKAEDLVHDTFVQFMLSRPDLDSVQNLEGYLYTMLRNTHISHVRRASQKPQYNLALVEFDSAEISLREADLRRKLQVQEELWKVCQYACLRKDTSKAGSILILRFFYGYYPSEISKVIRSPRQTVDSWLRIARSEAHLYLEDPSSLLVTKQQLTSMSRLEIEGVAAERFLLHLRKAIFTTRSGSCLSSKQLKQIYAANESATSVPTEQLGHIVSCPACLDAVNALLGLPLLSERDPVDTVGRDSTPKGGGGGGAPSGTPPKQLLKKCLNRFHQTFEHRPKELRIAVNGYVLATQKISAEINEQELNLDAEGKVNFVEVFSEQNFRLMLVNIDSPPDGAFEQHFRTELSNGRSLKATLNFGGTWPRLHVSYRDPLIRTELDPQSVIAEELTLPTNVPKSNGSLTRRSLLLAKRLAKLSIPRNVWLKPATVTAMVALLMMSVLVFLELRPKSVATISVAVLLNESAQAEEVLAARKDQVLHRTINLEEKSATGELLARRRIEVWQSADRGVTARRLYGDQGQLIAGDWRRADGVQTLYHHGTKPKIQLLPEKPALNFESVWQLAPSAREFSSLIADASRARVEDGPTSYVINYHAQGRKEGLVKASLTLSREDLRAIEQTLLIQQDNELREYSLVETSFQRHRPGSVAPAVFEPEPFLWKSDTETLRHEGTATESTSPLQPVTASPAIATPQLEIEVLQILNQIGADTGEQVSVSRTASGILQVDAVVDTEARKQEILKALRPVIGNPAVRASVQTFSERVAQLEKRKSLTTPGVVSIEKVEPATNAIPLEPELRRYFEATGVSAGQIDEEIQRFSRRVLGQSSQVLQHAGALKSLAGRFSADELRALDEESRSKWLALIRRHAQALQRANAALRRELSVVLAIRPDEVSDLSGINSDVEILQSINRLFALCSANDATVRAALTLSTDSSKASAIKSSAFWRSLADSEAIAKAISKLE